MTCKPSFAFLLACALAGCGASSEPEPVGEWRAMLARGDGIGAEAALRRELEEGGPRGAIASFLGEAALLQGNLDEARRWLNPSDFAPEVAAHGFRMLGRLRLHEGDLAGAGQAFDRALALSPESPALWVDIGRLRWRGGEQAQAFEASQNALALDPYDPAALLFRAQLVRDAQGGAAALPLLERGLAAAPDDPELLADYAATLGEMRRAKDMLAAVRRMPPGPRGYYLQAVLAARAGQPDLARSLLQRSGELERDMPAAMLLLALIDLDNGNAESAAQGLDKLLRRQPDNRRVRLLLGRALAIGGNHRELIARFGDQADSPYLAMLVGRAHEALGERDKAAAYLDRARRPLLPKLLTLRAATALDVARTRGVADGVNAVALVRGLIAGDRAGEARVAANAFLARHPGSADAMALAGDAALVAGDGRGALSYYRAAAAIRQPWPLTKRMAFALERLGERRGASTAVQRHLLGEPGNAEARAWLAARSRD